MKFERRALITLGSRLLLFTVPLLAVADAKPRALPTLPRQMYSAQQIAMMFDRPTSIAQLLTNLKIAMDRDLPLQPAFDDNAVLMKFFNGTTVQRRAVPNSSGYRTQEVFVSIYEEHFPKMTVRVQLGETPQKGYDTNAGYFAAHMRRVGVIEVNVESVPNFTVGAVRAVFGVRGVAERDDGLAPDGVQYVPKIKGTVVYNYLADGINESLALDTKRVTFQVELDGPNPREDLASPPAPIGDSDEVKDVRMAIWER